MGRSPKLSPQARSRICELASLRYTPTQIHKIHPEWKISTIKTTVKRESLRVDNITSPRSGRNRILIAEQRDKVYDTVKHHDLHIKIRDLLREVDDIVKKRTMQRLLRELGAKKWLQKKRQRLTPAIAQKRLDWALTRQRYTLGDWKKVLWSDECTVERGKGVKPIYTFTRPCDQIKLGDVKEVRGTGKGVSKMLWACFAWDRRSGFSALDGDPAADKGGITARVINAVYEAFLPEYMDQSGDGEFQHDGAGPHRGFIVVDALANMGIKVMI
jgi:hypothetical protein